MSRVHWLDDWQRESAAGTPRRSFLKLAHVIAVGVIRCASGQQAAAKGKPKRGNGKSHHKGNGKPKPKPPAPCSQGMCAAQWPDDKPNRDYCEFICRQCDGNDPRQFCIVAGTKRDGTPTKVARCCKKGEVCCDGSCVKPTPGGEGACCDNTWTYLAFDHEHCGACGNPCASYEECLLGQCLLCETCDPVCGPDSRPCEGDPTGCCLSDSSHTCCPTGCEWTASDPNHCGACGHVCPSPQQCVAGQCICPVGYEKYCPDDHLCIQPHLSCCNQQGIGCAPGYECCGSERNRCCAV